MRSSKGWRGRRNRRMARASAESSRAAPWSPSFGMSAEKHRSRASVSRRISRAAVENIEVRHFNPFENRRPAEPREPKLALNFRRDFFRKASAALEKLPRPSHFERRERPPALIEPPRAKLVERDAEAREVLQW